jgi:hypothetical protein
LHYFVQKFEKLIIFHELSKNLFDATFSSEPWVAHTKAGRIYTSHQEDKKRAVPNRRHLRWIYKIPAKQKAVLRVDFVLTVSMV